MLMSVFSQINPVLATASSKNSLWPAHLLEMWNMKHMFWVINKRKYILGLKGGSQYLSININWLLATQSFPWQLKSFLYKALRWQFCQIKYRERKFCLASSKGNQHSSFTWYNYSREAVWTPVILIYYLFYMGHVICKRHRTMETMIHTTISNRALHPFFLFSQPNSHFPKARFHQRWSTTDP